MDLLTIYSSWLILFSISFTLLPIGLVLDWRKRGTADGFSSVNFVLPMLMMSCWCKHGFLTDDQLNIFINIINLIFFCAYTAIFAYYQPKRKYLYLQLTSLAFTLYLVFRYVGKYPIEEQADKMGAFGAATQILGLVGGIYDLKRAISLKTMEYIPAFIQFGVFALTIQWSIFALIVKNYYMFTANFFGLVLNIVTLSFYFVYPPKTWRVPIFNVGGIEKKEL